MLSEFLKRATVTLIVYICGFQAFAWLLGILDEATKLLKNYSELGVLTLFIYYPLYYIGYDATLQVERLAYKERISKASLRPTNLMNKQSKPSKKKRRKKA